ncbi:phytanoyl-CoA dioxygenase family protein [Myroides sp. WP-1]|uniref:phytanoyl-CoA dioxygenase family protein n=1 Tax=Myroides sp. WP-1 TaxID=2759944 RepID=UPI0015F7E319|nr:phytanoyl-CoA dioxygenase family protein [Myroides sp. WP-1]MBB1140244.1 phytanoyl-CoA dioxygenase family protein [Myroides sp. WP-1]
MTELNHYTTEGYLYIPQFFQPKELQQIEPILLKFHQQWLLDHREEYHSRLINSHSLTSNTSLSKADRMLLFQFIAGNRFQLLLSSLIPEKVLFLNTQLFFDPFNKDQKNYWHRDIQYTGMSIEDQQKSILTQHVLHFRIPFQDEEGIELIPGTHRSWDLEEEQDVRLSQNGKIPSDTLVRGKQIKLKRGDLLIFSANMIHRGLYGNNRFALDLIFLGDNPILRPFIDPNNHPTSEEKKQLNSTLFL